MLLGVAEDRMVALGEHAVDEGAPMGPLADPRTESVDSDMSSGRRRVGIGDAAARVPDAPRCSAVAMLARREPLEVTFTVTAPYDGTEANLAEFRDLCAGILAGLARTGATTLRGSGIRDDRREMGAIVHTATFTRETRP